MSDMSNEQAPIPVDTEGYLPDTEGHLASFRQAGDAPEDDAEGHLSSFRQTDDTDAEDTEGHLAALRTDDDTEGHLRTP